MAEQPPRSRAARDAAESALVRVVHHYGGTPEFVLLGGLVPELLCANSGVLHAGTTDVDVQVNLEIEIGTVNVTRLERALVNAEFEPEPGSIWRWRTHTEGEGTVKFELLADLEEERAESIIGFRDCTALGAVNLRGTGYATKDRIPHQLQARIGGMDYDVQVNVTGLAGFLLAKTAAARRRRAAKDWYDIAFVLLHNDSGGPEQAATMTRERFDITPTSEIAAALDDLLANFDTPDAQGPSAYASQMATDHPELQPTELRADAVLAVRTFHAGLFA